MFQGNGETPFTYKDKTFQERNIIFADSNFFDMFSIRLLQGDPSNILKNPHGIILTESTAKKYSGDEDPIEKVF